MLMLLPEDPVPSYCQAQLLIRKWVVLGHNPESLSQDVKMTPSPSHLNAERNALLRIRHVVLEH